MILAALALALILAASPATAITILSTAQQPAV
jgi:hypothetical protein